MNLSLSTRLSYRFWGEAIIGATACVLGVITPFWPDWIEAVSGWDPDQHDGSVERVLSVCLLLIAAAFLALARRDWRRSAAAGAT